MRGAMSDDEEALLAAIIAEPWNDLPRYAYCDALIERGEDGESMRIQAAIKSVVSLTVKIMTGGYAIVCRRGFVAEIECTMEFWLENGRYWARNQPLEVVRITDKMPANFLSAYLWLPANLFNDRPALPMEIYGCLECRFHDTLELAFADLSQACIAWAKCPVFAL